MERGKLLFSRTQNRPSRWVKERLEKTLYLNPEIEEALEDKLLKLNVGLHVEKLQFGVYYRNPGDTTRISRLFSVEYEVKYADRSAGMLEFEYKHKAIRITVSTASFHLLCLNSRG